MKKADRSRTGIVFNIQKFSVNDGPGIRTVVFLKGCPLRCRWCSNPESQLVRKQVVWDSKACQHCLHCIDACVNHAVSIHDDHIHIDYSLCRDCGTCVAECPARALQVEGEIKTVQEVIDVVMQDEVFYEESGGGITLSGGEMLAQPEFAIELYRAAKEEGLHTCCETTGFASREVFERVIENIDYMLFDMKHYDPKKHQEGTGVTNDLTAENMKLAIAKGKKVLPRIPVIPGFNDSLQDAQGLALKLQYVGAEECQLLPFHQFGENKYDMLDQEYQYHDVTALHKEEMQDYLQVFLDHGIRAFF